MITGPAPKPTHLRILEGNPSRRPLNENEPKPRKTIPPCPKHLNDEARRQYRKLSRELYKYDLMTELDGEMLAGACVAWATWKDAVEKLNLSSPIVKSPKSGFPILHPYFSVAQAAWEQYRKVLSLFGMSPSDRTRVGVSNIRKSKSDMEEMIE